MGVRFNNDGTGIVRGMLSSLADLPLDRLTMFIGREMGD